MSDKLIEQIKADREAGTPGPWRIHDCESCGDRCKTFFKEVWNDETDILVTTEVTRAHNDGGTANMRRIARVPEYEDRIRADAEVIKAAEALGKWAGNLLSRKADPRTGGRVVLEADLLRLEESLAAFRQAQFRAEKGGE